MSKHVKYVPKHAAPRRTPAAASRRAARTTVLVSGLAVSATAATVGTGVIVSPVSTVATLAAEGSGTAPVEIAPAAGRATREDDLLSRDADRSKREKADRAEKKAKQRKAEEKEQAAPPAPTDPRDIAMAMLPEFGFGTDQFGCLDALWVSESDWRVDADNPTSSAYGIPQGLTETHDMPPGYMTSAEVQIRWGLGYIQDAYGSPCNAWSFKQGNGWY